MDSRFWSCGGARNVEAKRRWAVGGFRLCILQLFAFAGIGPATYGGEETGRISGDHVNVRVGPGRSYEIIGSLDAGSIVTVLGGSGDWAEIAPPETCRLWISSKHVEKELKPGGTESAGRSVAEEGEEKAPGSGFVALPRWRPGVVTGSNVRVRVRPAVEPQGIVAVCQKGDKVEIVGEFEGWYAIRPPGSIRTYVSSRYVERAEDLWAKAGVHGQATARAGDIRPAAGQEAGRRTLRGKTAREKLEAARSAIELAAGGASLDLRPAISSLGEILLSQGNASDEEKDIARELLTQIVELLPLEQTVKHARDARAEVVGRFKKLTRLSRPSLEQLARKLPPASTKHFRGTVTAVASEHFGASYGLTDGEKMLCLLRGGSFDLKQVCGVEVAVEGVEVAEETERGIPVVEVKGLSVVK